MAIYTPTLFLTEEDREVLFLLAQLVLASESNNAGNLAGDAIALSPREAARLLELLELFANSKLFIEGSYFSEGIANGQGWSDPRLKEIYLSWRSRSGHSRIASSYTWRSFMVRAGFNDSPNTRAWISIGSRSPVRPMSIEHFLSMERRLTETAKLHPRVADLIVAFVEMNLPRLEEVRDQKLSIPPNSIRSFVNNSIVQLSDLIKGREKKPMTRRKVVALSTIVMDTTALFATRDWTAAGVLSGIAAVLPDALGKFE